MRFYILILSGILLFTPTSSFSQKQKQKQKEVPKITLSGKVINRTTNNPVTFGVINFIDLDTKVRVDATGSYSIALPEAGTYAVTVTSPGLKMLRTTVTVTADSTRDFLMSPPPIKGEVTVSGERDLQRISRHTMTVKQLKEVPASFGDSLNALTSLPSVMRAGGGFFGPLIIRGADPSSNAYYIDEIPIYNPMHFGGIHSIINNELMSEIDLYASSFPAQFGGAQSAVININTIDDVKELGGTTDIGLISTAVLIKTPIKKDVIENGAEKKKNTGYFIVSGRVGYIPLLIRPIYKIATGSDVGWLPYYYDAQIKTRYDFDEKNSLTFLAIGSYDYIDAKNPGNDPKEDPLFKGAQFKVDIMSYSEGLTYTHKESDRLSNKVIAYGIETFSYTKLALKNSPVENYAKGAGITSKPFSFGLKDRCKFEWIKKHAELRFGADYMFNYFSVKGLQLYQKSTAEFNPADPNYFGVIELNNKIYQHTFSGYVENKFTLGGLLFVPGARAEYYYNANKAFIDPRGLISYTFPTETTIGYAGGQYSYFAQTSPYYFNQSPDYARANYADKQRAYHNAVSVEQKYNLLTFKVEGFYNYYKDFLQVEPWTGSDGASHLYSNCGQLKTKGIEVMLRLDQKENTPGFNGWMSYTYNNSKFMSGTPTSDPDYYNKWIASPYEMKHVVKFVGGYTNLIHTIGARLQLNTSAPYTPIIDDDPDMTYVDPNDPNHHRFVPVYGVRNSKRYPIDYRIDVRYSHKTNYEWGYVSWYIEVINITNKATVSQQWDYRKPYGDDNPQLTKGNNLINLFPNFGVEVKF